MRSSVRKNPGSTSMVRIPNGAISGVRASILALDAELRGGVSREELASGDAGGGRDGDDEPGPLGSHGRKHGSC